MLVAFDFARLARNQEDLGWIRNRVRAHRKLAVEASTGLDSENVGAGFMGVVSEQYLDKVRQDTHRGLRGRFDRKLSTGGTPFGYRTVPIITGHDAHGIPIKSGYQFEIIRSARRSSCGSSKVMHGRDWGCARSRII